MSIRTFEAALKAAGDPTRARILGMLSGGELCVCQVVAVLGLSASTVSKHLSLLEAAGFVRQRKAGRWSHFALAGEEAPPVAASILENLPRWIGDDPHVARDRERAERARAVGAPAVCEAGMTLPGEEVPA
jgi:DNA-binding transcriptional ArsR family regulator